MLWSIVLGTVFRTLNLDIQVEQDVYFRVVLGDHGPLYLALDLGP